MTRQCELFSAVPYDAVAAPADPALAPSVGAEASSNAATSSPAPSAGALELVASASTAIAAPADPADVAPAAPYLANLKAATSRRTMASSLDLLASLLTGGRADRTQVAWGQLRALHTHALRAAILHSGCAPATANRHLAALRGVLYHAWVAGRMSGEEYQRAIDLEPIPGSRLPAGRALSPGELRAMFAACAADPCVARGLRDAATIALLYQALLRRCEAVRIDVADYDAATGTIRVLGKGDKQDTVHVDGGGQRALDAWLAVRGRAARPLLCAIPRGGKIEIEERLTDEGIRKIVRRRAAQAGVTDVSCHDFRRSGISDGLDAGVDLSVMQQRARHADPKTTARYDRRGERAKREGAAKIHVPFVDPRTPT